MRIWLIYLSLIFSGLSFQNKPHAIRWVITNGCSLKVAGSTNVNNFSCDIIEYANPDTLSVTKSASQVLLSGNIKLDVQRFNCHNPVMTADLRKTLKYKEFPKVMIYFISMSKYPDAVTRQEPTKGQVVIVLAGLSRRYDVDYKIVTAEKNYISMVGSRKINFSDFNITPPRKLGGMIQTNNQLDVEFTLRMKVIE